MSASLTFERLSFYYGDTLAVDEVDLEVERGEIVTLVGPSGCGKSTLLKLVAGLLNPSAGRLLLDGADIQRTPPEKRQVGWMPQSYALFEHLNVSQNVAFGLRMQGVAKPVRQRRVEEVLALCHIRDLAERPVSALSGGQQQRVAVARALAVRPRVLLLDEPLAALDPQLRLELRASLTRLLRESGVTTLFVTHDQGEALALADRVAVLRGGRLEQFGTPEALWQTPRSAFVASFVGDATVLPTKRVSAREVEVLPGLHAPLYSENSSSTPEIALRPGDVVLAGETNEGARLEIIAAEYVGGRYQLIGQHQSGAELRFFSESRLEIGTSVRVQIRPDLEPVFIQTSEQASNPFSNREQVRAYNQEPVSSARG